MRTVLTIGGIQTIVSNKEYEFLEKFKKTPKLYKKTLSDFDLELARLLTSKGVIQRQIKNKEIYFLMNQNKGIAQ